MKWLIIVIILTTSVYSEDDFVIGKYNHLDKLIIQENPIEVIIAGDGEYLAGFLEAFYDNLEEGYRDDHKKRREILEEIKEARDKKVIKIEIAYDDNMKAYKETVDYTTYDNWFGLELFDE